MKKFKITFSDEWECENEEQVVEMILEYIADCAKFKDVIAFKIEEVEKD